MEFILVVEMKCPKSGFFKFQVLSKYFLGEDVPAPPEKMACTPMNIYASISTILWWQFGFGLVAT